MLKIALPYKQRLIVRSKNTLISTLNSGLYCLMARCAGYAVSANR